MNEIPAHCVKKKSDSLIVFSENKSKITFENPDHNTYRVIQVDGCVFNAADGHKCDKLLESEEYADQYFVELKGGDSNKAVEQLKDTIEKMPPRLAGAKQMAFAVFSNTCPKNDTKRQAIEKIFKNRGIFIKFCRTGETYRLEPVIWRPLPSVFIEPSSQSLVKEHIILEKSLAIR